MVVWELILISVLVTVLLLEVKIYLREIILKLLIMIIHGKQMMEIITLRTEGRTKENFAGSINFEEAV